MKSEIEAHSNDQAYPNDKVLSKLYEGIFKLYKKAGLEELQLVALEKAIELRPNDAALHFDAGLSSSSKAPHRLALLYYKYRLKFTSNDASGLNNMGIQYTELGMPLLGIACYKKSFKLKETLAAANLAYRYLQTGFAEETSQILEQANQYPNVYPNIASATAALSEKKDSESKKEGEVLEAARVDQRFLLSFGNAYFIRAEKVLNLSGAWVSSDGTEFEIKYIDGEIQVNWAKTFTYKLTGNISNVAAKVDAFRYDHSSKIFKQEGFGYLYLSSETEQIYIMTVTKPYYQYESELFTLSRVPAIASAE